jgi:hypothetical protein
MNDLVRARVFEQATMNPRHNLAGDSDFFFCLFFPLSDNRPQQTYTLEIGNVKWCKDHFSLFARSSRARALSLSRVLDGEARVVAAAGALKR